jgi:hypothetical protein
MQLINLYLYNEKLSKIRLLLKLYLLIMMNYILHNLKKILLKINQILWKKQQKQKIR